MRKEKLTIICLLIVNTLYFCNVFSIYFKNESYQIRYFMKFEGFNEKTPDPGYPGYTTFSGSQIVNDKKFYWSVSEDTFAAFDGFELFLYYFLNSNDGIIKDWANEYIHSLYYKEPVIILKITNSLRWKENVDPLFNLNVNINEYFDRKVISIKLWSLNQENRSVFNLEANDENIILKKEDGSSISKEEFYKLSEIEDLNLNLDDIIELANKCIDDFLTGDYKTIYNTITAIKIIITILFILIQVSFWRLSRIKKLKGIDFKKIYFHLK